MHVFHFAVGGGMNVRKHGKALEPDRYWPITDILVSARDVTSSRDRDEILTLFLRKPVRKQMTVLFEIHKMENESL